MAKIELPHDHGEQLFGLLENCPTPEEFLELSLLLRQLGDSSRLRLFWILCHCEECVINLSAIMGMSSPAVSHHLKQLRTGRAQLLHRFIEELIQCICPGTAPSGGNPAGKEGCP